MTKTKPRHHGYFSGFLLGALAGALAVFFGGTTKGKKLAGKIKDQAPKIAKKELSRLKKLKTKGQALASRYLDRDNP